MSSAPAVEILEGELRELIQRRDLRLDAGDAEVARLVDDAVELLHHRVAGFGALTPLLEDADIEEIWINEPGRVFVARSGGSELTTLVLAADEVEEIIERMLARAGRRLDRSQPF